MLLRSVEHHLFGEQLVSECVFESVRQVVSHESVLAWSLRESETGIGEIADSIPFQSLVIPDSSCLGSCELLAFSRQEILDLSVNHLHTVVNNDVAEGEEGQNKVVLAHKEGLLHQAVKRRAQNEEREEQVEHVVTENGYGHPEDKPPRELKGTNQNLNVHNHNHHIKHIIARK